LSLAILKCVNCGAPLPQPTGDYVKCEYCGYVQKIDDAKEYAERLKLEVYSWLSKIIPKFNVGGAGLTTIDPTARKAIFEMQVKPNISSLFSSIKPKFIVSINKPLISLPKLSITDHITQDDPKKIFEEVTKIQAISDLIVTEEDKKFVDEVIVSLQTYTFLNTFPEVQKKYDVASIEKIMLSIVDLMKSDKLNYLRFSGILRAYNAIRSILNNDAIGAERYSEEAVSNLQEAKKLSETIDPQYLPVIDAELSYAIAIREIAKTCKAYFEAGRQPIEFFRYLEENYFDALTAQRNKREIIDTLIPLASQLARAKVGKDSVYVLILNEGDYLLPFWEIESTFTYTTGIIFKKGHVSFAKLLVSALYPYIDPPWVNIISEDGKKVKDLSPILSKASTSSVPSKYKSIPPLINSRNAEILADNYFTRFKNIKFGASRFKRLIYISSFLTSNDTFNIGNIAVMRVNARYLNKLRSLILY